MKLRFAPTNKARTALGALLLLGAALPAAAQQNLIEPRSLAPYVPTPQRVVERMLEAAEVGPDDVVFDLGSGDGRILITTAEKFHAHAVGVEINPALVRQTRRRVAELGLGDRVTVLEQHLLEADLSSASVVTLYLLTSTNAQLRPKLESELKPGARVVSHDFKILGWTPIRTVNVKSEARNHKIFVYEIGRHKPAGK